MSTASDAVSSSSFKERFKALLGATLETWAHQLLYLRRVYPRSAFGETRFLGVQRCRVIRHPDVVSYVRDAVRVAVPALVEGVADEISLSVLVDCDDYGDHEVNDEQQQQRQQQQQQQQQQQRLLSPSGEKKVLERFAVRISDLAVAEWYINIAADDNKNRETVANVLNRQEHAMRDLILTTIHRASESMTHLPHLRRRRRRRPGNGRLQSDDDDNDDTDDDYSRSSVSFKLSLHVPKEDRSCSELNRAFADGTWFSYSASAGAVSTADDNDGKGETKIRPLHRSATPCCTIEFNMYYVPPPERDRKPPPPPQP